MAKQLAVSKATATKKIIALNDWIKEGVQTTIGFAIELGGILVQQKEALEHGEFTKWIEADLPFKVRAGQTYMKLFNNKKRLAKAHGLALLGDAYQLISGPKTIAAGPEVAKTSGNKDTTSNVSKPKTHQPTVEPKGEKSEDNIEPDPPVEIVTAVGQKNIPKHLLPVFLRAQEIKDEHGVVVQLMKRIRKAVNDKDPLWSWMHYNDLKIQADNVRALIRFCLPYATCPFCRGEDSDGCETCDERGFVNKKIWDVVPKDIREASL